MKRHIPVSSVLPLASAATHTMSPQLLAELVTAYERASVAPHLRGGVLRLAAVSLTGDYDPIYMQIAVTALRLIGENRP